MPKKTIFGTPSFLIKSVTASLSEEVETRGRLKAVLRQCLPQSLSPASQTSNSATMKKISVAQNKVIGPSMSTTALTLCA
ncbi:MAG: hypothetical protein SPK24_04895 [Candidatus Limisoma sp.]|nr:hypothetical protein [Candidatus Limisoma sp.]